MDKIPEYIDSLPNISGSEKEIENAIAASRGKPVYLSDSPVDFAGINSACAVALHMHQPLIPGGGPDLSSAEIISNLQYMQHGDNEGDRHNADIFRWCYQRMGEFIPQLMDQGKEPRIMFEYSGTLLHGLRQMSANDVFEKLTTITCVAPYRRAVEWLGCPWGHAVAPSTPVQDYRLHVKAWQHHFAAIFGIEALTRVRGFSPSEMALPNHPDVAYEFVKTLKDCGYQWVLVQEHTVEQLDSGWGLEQKHIPYRLVCQNSRGEIASIIAFIKTQGSDTKLVAQMQPYYEALGLPRLVMGKASIPPIVSQIADGENGGVMMNEFPSKFLEVGDHCTGSKTPLMNCTEYLEHLMATGVTEADLPALQPIKQKLIWDRFNSGDGPEKLNTVIEELKKEIHGFHMDGGSWTNNISWVQGYENVIGPMEKASSLFNERVLSAGIAPSDARYRQALFLLMCSQTSCYRYWGQGLWTDFGREICRRAEEFIERKC